MREDERLGDVLPHEYVRRLRPEDLRIELASDGDDDAPGQLAQPCERTLEEITGLQVEDRPECQVHRRPVWGRLKPIRRERVR